MSQGRLLPLPSGASGRRRTDLERAVSRARACEWGAWGCGGRATRVFERPLQVLAAVVVRAAAGGCVCARLGSRWGQAACKEGLARACAQQLQQQNPLHRAAARRLKDGVGGRAIR